MEYSFSQTFGRGAGMLQSSPTLSFHSSNRGGSLQGIDHSPVLESYQIGQKVKPYNQTNFKGCINELSKQARSYSHFSKSKQQQHRQADIKLRAEIKNVDGLNQRMLNLINQLKREYHISPKPAKEPVPVNLHNKQNNPKIDRTMSASLIKKPTFSSQSKEKNQVYQKNYHYNVSSRNYLGSQAKTQRGVDISKLKLKQKIQERLQSKKQVMQINHKTYGYNAVDLKKQAKPINSKANYVNLKGKVAGSWGETRLKQAEGLQKHKSVAFFKEREYKKQSWLKNKVKTIESEMETNYEWQQSEKNIEEFQEYSYVEEDGHGRKSKQQSVYEQKMSGKLIGKDCAMKCLDCGLRRECGAVNNHDFEEPVSQRNQNLYNQQSFDFENKLKSISDKIENYQRKLKNAGIDSGCFNMKNNCNSINKDPLHKNLRSMPFRKTSKQVYFDNCNHEDPIKVETNEDAQYQVNERKHTPSWGQFQSQKDTERLEVLDSLQGSKIGTGTKKVKAEVSKQNSKSLGKFNPLQDESTQKTGAGMSLKQRMSYKLATTNSALKISRQIELDEQFRKLKKQLSKLPDEVPGMPNNKWEYIAQMLQVQSVPVGQNAQIRQIFQLTDEEADPFFSIAIEDMQEYQQTICQVIQAYKLAEQYFYQNLLHRLPSNEVSQMFSSSFGTDQEVRLDHFTLFLSNATKINHKCRDVYLLFRRIINQASKERDRRNESKGVESISREDLIMILREGEETVRKTKQWRKGSQVLWGLSQNAQRV